MSLTAAELVAYLDLDKSGFDKKLNESKSQMQQAESKFSSMAKKSASVVGGGVAATAAGLGALTATTVGTGVAYNTLQQQARSALKTIMKDGDKANAQMDELDKFAKNSPFAKDVFIKAQQQLLGFGMEAEKVVPTLDAIQNSVAAVGGSNQEIAEITNVLAKVIGSGKLTAETFNELGVRGINAAEIIGSEMGKSGEEIRKSVTSGSLDADKAIKALTDGMQDRFGGAAAGVKETMTGAFDRIKAATRDTGSALAAPFVDPKGGGMAVTWANEFADVLRAVEGQAKPVVDLFVSGMGPAFDNFSILLKDAKDAVDAFDVDNLAESLESLRPYAPVIAGVTTALVVMGTTSVPVIGGLSRALGPLPAALTAAALASPELRASMGELLDAMKPLLPIVEDVTELMAAGLSAVMPGVASAVGGVTAVVGPMVEIFTELPSPVQTAIGAIVALTAAQKALPGVTQGVTRSVSSMASGIARPFMQLRDEMGLQRQLAVNVGKSYDGLGPAFSTAGGHVQGFRSNVTNLTTSLGKTAMTGLRGAASGLLGVMGGPWGLALTGATIAVSLWAKEQADAKARIQEITASLDEQTGALTENSREVVAKHLQDTLSQSSMDRYGVSLGQVTDAALGQAGAMDEIRAAVDKKIKADFEALPATAQTAQALTGLQLAGDNYIGTIEKEIGATSEAQEKQKQLADAVEETDKELSESHRSWERFNEALAVVSDDTAEMESRVKGLNTALDELEGGTKSQEEANRELEASGRDLNDFFKEAKDKSKDWHDALVDTETGMVANSEEGDRLNGILTGIKDDMFAAGIAASDQAIAMGDSAGAADAAKEAMEPYRAKIQELEDQGYLTQDQVDALTNSMLGVPEITSFLITDGDSITEADKKLLELSGQILSTPDKTITISEPLSKDVKARLEELGFKIEELPDGEVKITSTGEATVESVIASLTGEKNTVINLKANASDLREQITNSEDRLRELENKPTTPKIKAEIKDLKDKIKEGRSQLTKLENKKTEPKIDADTAPAKSDVKAFDKWLKERKNPLLQVNAKVNWVDEGMTHLPENLMNPNRDKSRHRAPGVELPQKATGGPIVGPGTGTSDSILTALSNGEHVWTAQEVHKFPGGHAGLEYLRAEVARGNYEAHATGGAVGSAESKLATAQANLDRISNAGQKRTAEDRRRDAAQKRVEKARADLDRAKEAERKAEDAKKAEADRRERVGKLRADTRVDIRRGNIRDQVTGSLSGGYTAIDQLVGMSNNEDLSKGSRSKAAARASKFEANLKNLYGRAEKIDEKLEKAKKKAEELQGISDSVSSRILNDRKIDVGDYQNFSGGKWTTHSGVAGAQRRMSADVGTLKSFADKLQKLQKAGIPGAILQEIAEAGPEEGMTLADAFLGASKSEQSSYLSTWSDYEKQSKRVGDIVTGGFYKGGVDAANGVVKGLEGQQKSVQDAITNLAKSIETTFKQVLGIASPSKVMGDAAFWVPEAARLKLLEAVPGVQDAAEALGAAMVPGMPSVGVPGPEVTMPSADGGMAVTNEDAPEASSQMQSMSDETLTAMETMRVATVDNMLLMQEATNVSQTQQALDTQLSNQTQVDSTTQSQQTMQSTTALAQQAMAGSLTANQQLMLGTLTTSQAAMLLQVQTQQEAMRSTTSAKQVSAKNSVSSQQEAMRVLMSDKQNSMRVNTETQFESMRHTVASKLLSAKGSMNTTMSTFSDEFGSHLGSLERMTDSGFSSMESSAKSSFRGMRKGMNAEMEDARPQVGSRLNKVIDVLGSFSTSINKAFKELGVDLPAPKRIGGFAEGGTLNGWSPGHDTKHFVSPTGESLSLSGGESFMIPQFTQQVGGEIGVKKLNKMAKQGQLRDFMDTTMDEGSNQAFADGGVWRNLWAMTKKQFPDASLNSAYRGGSITASGNRSHHARGNAIDVNPSMEIFNWWRNNHGANLAELIYSPANKKQIKNGQNYMYTGAVRGMHFNHVHIAAVKALSEAMAGGLPGMGGEMAHPFLDRAGVKPGKDLSKSYGAAAKKLAEQITQKQSKKLPGGMFKDMGTGVMEQISKGLEGKAEKYGKSMDFVDPGGSGVMRWRDTVMQALQRVGLPTSDAYVNAWLRQIKSESGGNPNIRQGVQDVNSGGNEAMGLVQVIPGTFNAYRDKSLPNDRTHPLANLVAGMRYANSRYPDMLSVIGKGHGYANGTENATAGVHLVGEHGPELRYFKGGETVKSAPKTRDLMSGGRITDRDAEKIAKAMASQGSSRDFVVQGDVYTQDPDELFAAKDKIDRRRESMTIIGGGLQ